MKLVPIDGVLHLTFPQEMDLAPFAVFFDRGALDFKRRLGGRGGGHLIYKAIGKTRCRVLDVTAGWCRDAFLLASLGCDVTAVEKSELIFKLLEDAVTRGQSDSDVGKILTRLHINHGDGREFIEREQWDVVCIDPMFTGVAKKGLNKKESQVLQKLGTYSSDAELEALIDLAIGHSERVVVKRPLKGSLLRANPVAQFKSGSTRFDVYKGVDRGTIDKGDSERR